MKVTVSTKNACAIWGMRPVIYALAAICIIGLQGRNISDAAAAVQATYYLSPSGSDANAGTLDAPFQSIKKACDEVQKINKNMTGDIIVYLRGGIYTIDSTIHIGNSMSGTNGYTVKFMNYNTKCP